MNGPGNLSKLTNVFVLMLENHSFDNIFGRSGIPGICAAPPYASNMYWGKDYPVTCPAPPSMTTDPGHEFDDVLEQICGPEASDKYTGGEYPKITNSGFARSYATSTSEDTGTPDPEHFGDIMACFNTPEQLPVIHKLATEYAICDHWFSSIPGPTWPNRFFVHGASSSGWTQSPTLKDEVLWELIEGFSYENGSIYDALAKHFDAPKTGKQGWRLYQDKCNDFTDTRSDLDKFFGGWISQVASLKGICLTDIHSLRSFENDLNALDGKTPAYHKHPYTFIEPNFGKSFLAPQKLLGGKKLGGPTYKSGSSQHPEDDPYGGENLIKFVYEKIRASPVWETSLLLIVYDEHGGFYDSGLPGYAEPPEPRGTYVPVAKNPRGFGFDQYGVRVPAVVVSPFIQKGTVDHTVYCHASVPKTLETWLGMPPLTGRDKAANDLGHLLSLDKPRPDADCPTTLPNPAPVNKAKRAALAAQVTPERLDLPAAGNVVGFLFVLLKYLLECGLKDKPLKEVLEEVEKILKDIISLEHAGQQAEKVWKLLELECKGTLADDAGP